MSMRRSKQDVLYALTQQVDPVVRQHDDRYHT